MAKEAMEGIAKMLVKKERSSNIRINTIALGLVETEMGRRLVKTSLGKEIKELYPDMPFDSVHQPSDVGNLRVFLCLKKGGYISSHTIYVDGGANEVFTDAHN